MRIALLTSTFSHFSGIDRVVYDQAKIFLNQGHNKVTVVTLDAAMELDQIT